MYNTGAAAAQVSLYPAAASITAGSFLGAPGNTSNELSTWTSVAPEQLSVDPGAKQTATITVKVPQDAASGERDDIVWAQVHSVLR